MQASRRRLVCGIGMALVAPVRVGAQGTPKRIGVIYYGNTYEAIAEGLRIGLKETMLVRFDRVIE